MKVALFVALALAVAGVATAQAPNATAAANATAPAAAAGAAAPPPPAKFYPTVTDAAEANSLVAFVAALKDHGLADAVNAKNLTATIFAPTDEAFQKLADSADDAVQELIADKDKMAEVLKYHVVPGAAITGARLTKLIDGSKTGTTSFATLEAGERINATLVAGAPAVNGVPVNDTGVQGAKSIIHTINEVLLPPSLIPAKAPNADKAKAASGAAGLAAGAALALPLLAAALL